MTDPARTVRGVREVLRSAGLLLETIGPEDVDVSGVCQDSRRVAAGDVFVAWRGSATDAHDFVPDAVDAGAVAAVVERQLDIDVPQLVVEDGRRAAALTASAVHGWPAEELLTIGVTGTNGKTTTVSLIGHLLRPDYETAVIGTLGLSDGTGVRPGTEGLTTPGPVQVAVWLRELADGGTGAVVLEASSHALEQRRLDGISFDIAVFTNLSQDHLDYHGDLQRYRAAKARLVELVRPGGIVVVNEDDPGWEALDATGRTRRGYAVERAADVRASDFVPGPGGSELTLTVDGAVRRIRTTLVGRYNLENSLAAVAAALAAAVPLDDVCRRLSSAPPVAGRLELLVTDPFTVLIDFAHTPDALRGALAAVAPLTEGRLIVVFGAGGDRDPTKRSRMAEAVREVADVIVLTSDNPRTEDPEQILDDVAVGLAGVDYERHVDRRVAIARALEIARPGDTVVLAGKGHETYQVVGTEKLPFDEREIVRACLADAGSTG